MKTAWCGLIVAATVLAGCARDEAIEIVEDNAPDTCGADLFPLGIHIDDAGDAERSAETRVIRPGDAGYGRFQCGAAQFGGRWRRAADGSLLRLT